jgi:hypothetical protein
MAPRARGFGCITVTGTAFFSVVTTSIFWGFGGTITSGDFAAGLGDFWGLLGSDGVL